MCIQYSVRNRLETTDNVIICGMYLSHFPLQSGIWDWWHIYYGILSIFLNIYLHNICIFCKILYGLCFRNKHIMIMSILQGSLRPNLLCVLLAQWLTWLTWTVVGNPKVPSSIPAGGKDFP